MLGSLLVMSPTKTMGNCLETALNIPLDNRDKGNSNKALLEEGVVGVLHLEGEKGKLACSLHAEDCKSDSWDL